MTRKWEPPNADDLIARYLAGTSLKQLSEQFGVSRPAITRALRDREVRLRSQSEAETLKWRTIKADRRLIERQCGAAWKAARGRIQSAAELIRRAATRAERLTIMTPSECILYDLLRAAGLRVIPQYASGPYNIDLGLAEQRIAVEVQTAYMRGGKSVRPKRLSYLLDQGWCLLIVHARIRKRPDWRRIAQHIIAIAELTGRDPSLRSQYRVINSYGKTVAARRPYLDGWPVIPRDKPKLNFPAYTRTR